MIWAAVFLPEAEDDFSRLDGSQQKLVAKAIQKARQNPLPTTEGGYGKPLGNHAAGTLAGLMRSIKRRKDVLIGATKTPPPL